MSATLTVELDPGPVERTHADVVVVFFFDSDRPLRGGAGRADWRLCGQLSRLILAGKLTGARGDAVLMPTGGGPGCTAADRSRASGPATRSTQTPARRSGERR